MPQDFPRFFESGFCRSSHAIRIRHSRQEIIIYWIIKMSLLFYNHV